MDSMNQEVNSGRNVTSWEPVVFAMEEESVEDVFDKSPSTKTKTNHEQVVEYSIFTL